MKNSILILFCILAFISLKGQESPNCYQKYAEVFEIRGANDVKDGTYEDVIVTIRKRGFADCFIGKVTVKDGKINLKSIQLSFVDDTFEPFVRTYKDDDPITIVNGISKTLLTKDEELVNIMFVHAIKPKKKEFKRAPEPAFN